METCNSRPTARGPSRRCSIRSRISGIFLAIILAALGTLGISGELQAADSAETSPTARDGDFEQAAEFYDAGKFAEAKQTYQSIVERGEWSSNLFYNLGDTEFRLGEQGRAALNFERALALAPGHPEAQRNLKLVRTRTGAHVEETAWHNRLFPNFSVNIFAGVTSVAGWLAVFFLVILRNTFNERKTGLRLALAGSVLLAAYAGAGLWQLRDAKNLAIIVAAQTEARLAPADRAAVSQSLPAGSRVHVLSERGEWIYCKLPRNGLGWIPSSALEKVHLKHS